ncbi:conserved hypothetical protein [Ramlibacter tataouinensis TTB310]|uniref:Uncharacterized protein n=1 Tax=Ramlibacter tataouinensis (strain ATCC BAA-407 / DSM 14655 / LMG 21543 / TTB310) TaxID=365046 RepID=F5Y3L8_RAMTT|nr:conserved hypothetical protein [Ramlibacter tataouinensis TTB310]
MEVVHYATDSPCVGNMKCLACERVTPAWQSSGMGESFPHFYCDTCSSVIHREQDKELVDPVEPSQQLLDQIATALPNCPCGGRFRPGANPKCPHCRAEYKHPWSPVQRLTLPHVILLDGACLIRDRLYSYQVSIGSKAKYWLRVVRRALA